MKTYIFNYLVTKKLFFPFFLILIFMSCSGPSEGKVKQILRENLTPREKYCFTTLPSSWIGDYKSYGNFCTVVVTNPPSRYEADKINFYLKKGLLKLSHQTKKRDCAEWKIYKLEPTKKGKKYILSSNENYFKVITAVYDIGKIKNIYPFPGDKNYKIVEYDLTRKTITPFGEYGNYKKKCRKNITEEKTLVKSNRGWVLVK